MTEETIYRLFFELVKESRNWAMECPADYPAFIEGATVMAERMVKYAENNEADA